jgi:hypothetical protein
LKSRSSTSFSAEVKNFVAPIAVNISNCGTITIHEVTENGDASFGYTTTVALSPATFNLSNGGTQAYTGVQVGQYSVTESTPPAGWTLKSRYRHHWMVHEGGWQIVRGDDRRMLTIPPLVAFGSLARGPD